jgi:hypothetical protein
MTKETYLKSIDILLDVYNNGTLFHGSCGHCAVGSLLGTSVWDHDFMTFWGRQRGERDYAGCNLIEKLGIEYEDKFTQECKIAARQYLDNLYKEHGFTRDELAKIEYAFESSIYNTPEGYDYYRSRNNIKKGQFIGLTAVLGIMKDMVEEEVPSQNSQNRLEKIAREKYSVTI